MDSFRNKSDLNNLKSTDDIRNPWISNQLWMAHAVVTSKKKSLFNEKIFSWGNWTSRVKNITIRLGLMIGIF